jgi:hypothetical protein
MSTCPSSSDSSESSCLSGTYALVPVHLSPVDGSECLDAECPEDAFYTLTSEKIFTVPAVGEEANMEVCDPGAFVEGQWIQHPLGKFRITKVEPACLTVANGCPNESAVLGNEAPGSTVSGRVPIWVTEYDCSDDSVCDQLLTCIDEGDDISFTNTPVADTDGGEYHLFGGEIDDACGSGTDNASKLHKIEGITSDGKTLTFKEMPERDDESEDTFYRIVGEQVDGCEEAKGIQLKLSSNPANAGVYVMCGGKEVFVEVPEDYDEKSYVLQPGDSGCPEWVENSGNIFFGCYAGEFATDGNDQTAIVPSWSSEVNDSGFVVDSTEVEVPTTGNYKITLTTGVANNAANDNNGNVYFGLHKNGALQGNYRLTGNASVNDAGSGHVEWVIPLVDGDKVSIKGRFLSSPSLTPQGEFRLLDPCIIIEKK